MCHSGAIIKEHLVSLALYSAQRHVLGKCLQAGKQAGFAPPSSTSLGIHHGQMPHEQTMAMESGSVGGGTWMGPTCLLVRTWCYQDTSPWKGWKNKTSASTASSLRGIGSCRCSTATKNVTCHHDSTRVIKIPHNFRLVIWIQTKEWYGGAISEWEHNANANGFKRSNWLIWAVSAKAESENKIFMMKFDVKDGFLMPIGTQIF